MAPEEIEKLAAINRSGQEPAEMDVWPDHWPAFFYLSMAGHWRVVVQPGDAWWQGLEYTALPGVLEMQGVPRDEWPDTLSTLRRMETAALEVLNDSDGK